MVRDDFRGDFTGFEFGGVHSAELGITRVSGGDRYSENLHPEIKDITAEVPGMDGQYYFGSNYGTRAFDVEFAFDSLTEYEFRRLRTVFGTKEIKQLIFDERPYKYYMAKIENPIELSYICFDEPKRHIATQPSNGIRKITRIEQEPVIDTETGEPIIDEETGEPITQTVLYRDPEQIYPYIQDEGTERIYKGEGKISFICYFPFAKSVYKTLLDFNYRLTTDTEIDVNKTYYKRETNPISYVEVDEPLLDELSSYYEKHIYERAEDWVISSGILSATIYQNFDKPTIIEQQSSQEEQLPIYNINIYNAGDMDTGFRLYIPGDNNHIISELSLVYKSIAMNSEPSAILQIGTITLKVNGKDENQQDTYDVGILIDTNNGLITGVSDFGWDQSGNALYTTSGNLYNEFVDSGYFFKLKPNISSADGATLQIVNGVADMEIFYDYLYL